MKRAAFLAALALGGCTAPAPKIVTQVQVVRQTIPPELLRDPAPPATPKTDTAGAISAWIVRLWADDLNKTDQLAAIARFQPKGKH